MSRSTWACELKLPVTNKFTADTSHAPRERVSWNLVGQPWFSPTLSHAPRERVSWNSIAFEVVQRLKRHAPRERVSWNCWQGQDNPWTVRHAPRERVSWNHQQFCMLDKSARHAPRERVSWNKAATHYIDITIVTLHVSVWVEIFSKRFSQCLSTSRSTWACELKWRSASEKSVRYQSRSTWACELKCKVFQRDFWNRVVTLHVSVWVEIFHFGTSNGSTGVTLHVSVWVEILCCLELNSNTLSRSTWACELKSDSRYALAFSQACHAPRERVSWNKIFAGVTPATLQSRSTWACELKWHVSDELIKAFGHAPRERVSWNRFFSLSTYPPKVTLHVSVWVEIKKFGYDRARVESHAPRERVSWNEGEPATMQNVKGHAPRERVSWNWFSPTLNRIPSVTLHVSVWVEMKEAVKKINAMFSHAPRERVSWNALSLPVIGIDTRHAPR